MCLLLGDHAAEGGSGAVADGEGGCEAAEGVDGGGNNDEGDEG